jgi:hypothetical protein
MKMLFWNIRDWGQEGRRRQLKDFINREGVDMIGVQETIMDDFSMNELEQIGGKVDFVWNWLSAMGHSGGILLGIKEDVVEVGVVDQGEFFSRCPTKTQEGWVQVGSDCDIWASMS